MSVNAEEQAPESDSILQSEDWVAMLTGGLITGGIIGWSVYKSKQLDFNEIIPLAATFVGGMGIYFTSSALISLSRKSRDSQRKPVTPKKDASDLTTPRYEASKLLNLLDRANEWDKIFVPEATETTECKVLDKKISKNIVQETVEVPSKCEDMTTKLNVHDLNRQGQRNELQELPTDNQMEACYNEELGSRKAKFREEIISYIHEMNGYIQGTIDPLPLARNILFQSEIREEMSRESVMIVKEYASSLLPKLELAIEEFLVSLCKAEIVPKDVEYKKIKACKTLGAPEKPLSEAPLKIDMNQYYNGVANETRNKSQMPSCQNSQRSGNASGASARPPETVSSSLHERNTWTRNSENSSSTLPRLATPSTAGIPFKSQGVNKPNHHGVENLKSPHSKPPSKLVLSREQLRFLNILKSEL